MIYGIFTKLELKYQPKLFSVLTSKFFSLLVYYTIYTPIRRCKSSNKFVTMLKGDYMSYYRGVNIPLTPPVAPALVLGSLDVSLSLDPLSFYISGKKLETHNPQHKQVVIVLFLNQIMYFKIDDKDTRVN